MFSTLPSHSETVVSKPASSDWLRALRLVGCTMLAMLLSQVASAETYRWVDNQGVVNYSERKPTNIPEERISVISNRATAPSSTPSRLAPAASAPTANSDGALAQAQSGDLSPDQQALLEELQANERERQDTVEEIRRGNCEKSQQVLTNLTRRGRIRVNEADGTQRVMPEEERQQRISETQAAIAENCVG